MKQKQKTRKERKNKSAQTKPKQTKKRKSELFIIKRNKSIENKVKHLKNWLSIALLYYL